MIPHPLWADPESYSADPETAWHYFLAESFRRRAAIQLWADCPHQERFHQADYQCSGESPYLDAWYLAELPLVD